jgi:hypothetical protein
MLSLFWLIIDIAESGCSFCLAHSYKAPTTVAYKGSIQSACFCLHLRSIEAH